VAVFPATVQRDMPNNILENISFWKVILLKKVGGFEGQNDDFHG